MDTKTINKYLPQGEGAIFTTSLSSFLRSSSELLLHQYILSGYEAKVLHRIK